jgi:DNA-binding transcriptional ArsR family regulator
MAYWNSKQGEREAIDRLIRQNPGISPAEVTRRLGVARSTVLRQLPSLEEAGYLYSEDERGGLRYYKRRR